MKSFFGGITRIRFVADISEEPAAIDAMPRRSRSLREAVTDKTVRV